MTMNQDKLLFNTSGCLTYGTYKHKLTVGWQTLPSASYYSPTITRKILYTEEDVAGWPTAVLKSDNHADDAIFPGETKSNHISQIELH